jgi:hypothetical protein
MTDHDENWAKAENPEVESAKHAFAEAQEAARLRQHISQYAAGAVKHGSVDRDWANARLAALGASPVTGTAEYRMNVPITGAYGWRCKANSRTEALERFNQQVNRVAMAGKITADGSYDNVYELFVVGEPTFYSGPEDAPEPSGDPISLDDLKAGIRAMLKQGVAEKGWGFLYAVEALKIMGLEPLPALVQRTVEVAVSGTVQVQVKGFEGDDEEALHVAAAGMVGRSKYVTVIADEVGASHIMPVGARVAF